MGYLPGFTSRDRALWGRHPVHIPHALADSGLFTLEALAELVEGYPRAHYDLLHMGAQGTGNLSTWDEGELGDAGGDQVVDAITHGRMWLNLRRVHEVDARYRGLLDEVFAELATLVPGFSTFKHNLGILLSSPGAQVYYHADVPGQSLWQLQGNKRVYVYPNHAPFLPEDQVEKIILSLTEAEIDYEEWFDEHATVFDLTPGHMLHWPLNAPHRVENGDMVNISVTTEHWTPEIRNLYAARYFNGVLRNRFGVQPRPPLTRGPGFWARAAVAAAIKTSGRLERHHLERWVRWRLDPHASDRMGAIEPYLL